MELLPNSKPIPIAIDASLQNSFFVWWRQNQILISWITLIAPIAIAMIYGAVFRQFLPCLFISPFSIFAAFLIYRSTVSRLKEKTNEVEALSKLHLATAEALATAIDAKDQISHCHVWPVQVYAARMGKIFGLSENEISALKAGALLHDVGK